jgi:hypothetical protein
VTILVKVPARIDILDASVTEARELSTPESLIERSNSVERGTQESNTTEEAWKTEAELVVVAVLCHHP